MTQTSRQPQQFNITQLLILTTLIALLLAAVLHFEWLYFPSLMLDFYNTSPLPRKIIIIFVVSLLPTLVMGVLVWSVFRMPYLIANHKQVQKRRNDRREKLRQEMLAKQAEAPKSSPLD